MPYTTSDLLSEIKQRSATPESQETYTNASFLRLATNELYNYIVPLLTKTREEYLIREKDYTLTSDTTYVVLPERSVGSGARDVFYIDANGDAQSVAYLDSEQRERGNSASYARQFMVYFKWDQLVLVGQVPPGGLRISYYCRPGQLIETSAAGLITAIDTGTGEVTLSSVPSTFTTATPLDIISSKGTYPYHEIDQTPTAVSATSVTFSTLPTDLIVGDYITLSDQSPLPQIPREFQPILAQRTVVKVLESQGDHAALDRAKIDLAEMENGVMSLIHPRLQGEPKKIVSGMASRGWWA